MLINFAKILETFLTIVSNSVLENFLPWRFLGFILAGGSFKEHVILEMIGPVDEQEGEEKATLSQRPFQ